MYPNNPMILARSDPNAILGGMRATQVKTANLKGGSIEVSSSHCAK
jgi:hypothetical protein